MSGTSGHFDLFVGPAVVVDDEIDDPRAGVAAILQQIREAHVPLIAQKTIPDFAEIKHWRGFSMIVLDWDLKGKERSEWPTGVPLPPELEMDNVVQSANFVRSILESLYCPIFILSSQDVGEIWRVLERELGDVLADARARVLVQNKESVATGLFDELSSWLTAKPAIYALKSWEAGYEDAKQGLFKDLQASAWDWPKFLWNASLVDGVNPSFELTETLSRNILHRFEPLVFDEDVLGSSPATNQQAATLRRVLNRQSVISGGQLHEDVLMPGDFFYESSGDSAEPDTIKLNLTPSCDLVARPGQELDDVVIVLVEAKKVPASESATPKARASLARSSEASHNQVVHILLDSGTPYRVQFKTWSVATWGEMKGRRQGRLLDPYTSLLLQKFGLHFVRQGIPRLPEEFFE